MTFHMIWNGQFFSKRPLLKQKQSSIVLKQVFEFLGIYIYHIFENCSMFMPVCHGLYYCVISFHPIGAAFDGPIPSRLENLRDLNPFGAPDVGSAEAELEAF